MKTLAQQQDIFQQYLLQNNNDILEMVVGNEQMSAESRLQIYSDAYRIRLTAALNSTFPILSAYLGNESFALLSENYIKHHPSHFRNIRWYGHQLHSFLKNKYDHPYLAELAEFEWTMTLSFDAVDCPIVSIEDVAKIPPNKWIEMKFTTHPAVIRLNFTSNAVAIWEALSTDQDMPEAYVSNNPSAWVLWRHDYENRFCLLPQDEAWAVDALINGASFGEICEGLCQWVSENDAGTRAASLLKSWLQSGLITNVQFAGENTNE